MKSKVALFAALDKFGKMPTMLSFVNMGLKHPKISDETYGKKSMIYINAGEVRRELEAYLKGKGFKVFPEYAPQGGRLEVQVSYFKGWHWDE